MRFWDSSAIVPLLVEQTGSEQADAWFRADAELVLWTLTGVEITSALWRLVREGALIEEHAASQSSVQRNSRQRAGSLWMSTA